MIEQEIELIKGHEVTEIISNNGKISGVKLWLQTQ
jgi:phytoene desaturase